MKTVLTSLVLFISTSAFTQTLEEQLAKSAEDVARGYVAPVTSAYAANLNSGWASGAPGSKMFGLDLDVGMVVMGTLFSEENRTFSRSGSFVFDNATVDEMTRNVDNSQGARDSARMYLYGYRFTTKIYGPTIIGSKSDSIHVAFTEPTITVRYNGKDTIISIFPVDTALPITGLLDNVSTLLLAAPQLSIGTVYGTKVTVRYLPTIKLDDETGDLNYFGFGIQHNPFVWLPIITPPIDASLGYFTQKLTVGEILKTTTTLVNITVSKTLGWGALNITPYVAFSKETAQMDVAYTYDAPDPSQPDSTKAYPINFTVDGENTVRSTFGAALKLGVFKVSAEYNIAKYNSFAVGLGLII